MKTFLTWIKFYSTYIVGILAGVICVKTDNIMWGLFFGIAIGFYLIMVSLPTYEVKK